MNIKTCLMVVILLTPSWSQARAICEVECNNPPPPAATPTPKASDASSEESKKVVNNASQEKLTGKKPPVPEFSGRSGLSDALIQFETPPPSNNSKNCS